MSTRGVTPRLAGRLCSLAESQLQMQTARSAALDAGALGVIAVAAGVAAIIIGARGTYGLWIVALVLLGLSLGVAVRTLRLPGAEDTGPSVAAMHEARETQDDNELERSLLEGLAEDVQINDEAGRTQGNRHFESTKLPSLGGTGPILPEWLRKLFRRKDTPAH